MSLRHSHLKIIIIIRYILLCFPNILIGKAGYRIYRKFMFYSILLSILLCYSRNNFLGNIVAYVKTRCNCLNLTYSKVSPICSNWQFSINNMPFLCQKAVRCHANKATLIYLDSVLTSIKIINNTYKLFTLLISYDIFI